MESPITLNELIEKIENYECISNVNTSLIDDMSYLFCISNEKNIYRGKYFNQPLNKWDVSNVKTMEGMFSNATGFNQPLNDWDVSNVEVMSYMFEHAEKFNHPLNDWDVSKVKKMSSMFQYAKSFNHPLNDWDVSNVNFIIPTKPHTFTVWGSRQ